MSRWLLQIGMTLLVGALASAAQAAVPTTTLPVTVIVHGPLKPEGSVSDTPLAFTLDHGAWKGAAAVRISRRWNQTLRVRVTRQLDDKTALVTFPVLVNGLEAKGLVMDLGDLTSGRCEPEMAIASFLRAGGHKFMGGARMTGRVMKRGIEAVVGSPAQAAPMAQVPAIGLQRYSALWGTVIACEQTPPRDPGFVLVAYKDTLSSAMDVWLTAKAPVFDKSLVDAAHRAEQAACARPTRKCADLQREMGRATLALGIFGSSYVYDGVKAWAAQATPIADPDDLNDAIAYLRNARAAAETCGTATDLRLGRCGPEADTVTTLIRQFCGQLAPRQVAPANRQECAAT